MTRSGRTRKSPASAVILAVLTGARVGLTAFSEAPTPTATTPALGRTLEAALQLLNQPDPPTAVFQTRVGLSVLELDRTGRQTARILDRLVSVARLDAYAAAREALCHPLAASALDDRATSALHAVITTAGLQSGVQPAHHHEALTGAVGHAETELEKLLHADPDPGQGSATGAPRRTADAVWPRRRFGHFPPAADPSRTRAAAPSGLPDAGNSGMPSTTE
ncbi:hypothetical protein [Streptomyces parvulus]|uniref:hypothetical protein n=1 Tax=Streptomyces parvulus TaxID=146923 RepID=UPI0036FBEBCC